jgi:hypothetical protein
VELEANGTMFLFHPSFIPNHVLVSIGSLGKLLVSKSKMDA